jgi:DNA polymerase-3 subunit gamma/tau
MVGQSHITNALRNAVREDRTGHAYLFSGPRGTGKTTTARILARALNCLELGADGEPCGKCENCQSFTAGSFFDLVELDAASNRGIDSMRDLIPSMYLGLGATSRRKVFVLDEVHMLTDAASNMLLKTLEEPPAHVTFVLATTDPHHVLPTIRSRTQHFEFTLLTHEQLVGHLRDILTREGVEADDETLDVIARRAGGSARDALSLLDQALAVGGGSLDDGQVLAALGGVPFEQRVAILDATAAEDVAGALAGVHELLVAGHDARRVADDLLRTLRDAFLCANAAGRVPYDGPATEADALTDLAQRIGNVALVRGIELLGQAIVDIRGQAIADPRLVLEVAVVRLARREARTREETLLDRVERLEKRLDSGAGPAPAAPAAPTPASTPARAEPTRAKGDGPILAPRAAKPKPVAAPQPRAEPAPEPVPSAPASKGALDLDDVILAWPAALEALKAPVRATVVQAQPIGIEDGVIVFGAPRQRFEAINARFRGEASAIKDALEAQLGTQPRILVRPHDFDTSDALRPTGKPAEPAVTHDEAPPDDHDEHIDLDELADSPTAPAPDPAARLMADLGAEVVEERARD